ncbi:HTH_Tnp_Tc3_2 domain-containing protein [Trichonephila clavipes]|nr:HTH_Tnp_Tc3_2 domain-containing protein [Trichonephila clavipes]
MDGGQKTTCRANCKGQLTLIMRGERRLSRIVRSQRNQTVAQITTQLNDGASRTVRKRNVHRNGMFTVWVSGAIDFREYHCSMLAIGLDWAREHRDWRVEDWKRVAWVGESRFRLLNTDRRLKIWRQAHEVMDPASQVGTVQGHGGSIMFWGALGIFGACTNLPQCNTVHRVAG